MESRRSHDGVSMEPSGGAGGNPAASFATRRTIVTRMSDGPPTLRIRKKRLIAYRGRGQIYNWLRGHFERVREMIEKGEATWPSLCLEMVRHDVSDRDGGEPTAKAAARVWRRVREDVGDSPPAYRFKNYPSRMPKDWKPEAFRLPAAEPTSGSHLTPGIHSGSTSLIRNPSSDNAGAVRKLTGKEKIARLKLELAGRRGA